MTTGAETNFGAQVWLAPHGETLVMVAELVSVDPPGETRGTIDVTTHDSPEDANGGVPMQFIGEKVFDPGEFTFKINHKPGSVGDEMIRVAVASPNLYDCKVVDLDENGAPYASTGSGFVTSYQPDSRPVNGVKTATVKVKRSGVWTYGA